MRLRVSDDHLGLNRVTLHTLAKPLELSEVVFRESIRVTDPERSILDSASAGTARGQIEMAVRQALPRGLTTRRLVCGRPIGVEGALPSASATLQRNGADAAPRCSIPRADPSDRSVTLRS